MFEYLALSILSVCVSLSLNPLPRLLSLTFARSTVERVALEEGRGKTGTVCYTEARTCSCEIGYSSTAESDSTIRAEERERNAGVWLFFTPVSAELENVPTASHWYMYSNLVMNGAPNVVFFRKVKEEKCECVG